jgi:hypothetical protein
VAVGDREIKEGITLTNVGTASTAPIQLTTQAPFSVYKTSCQQLAPNQSCEVWCSSRPSGRGSSWRPCKPREATASPPPPSCRAQASSRALR